MILNRHILILVMTAALATCSEGCVKDICVKAVPVLSQGNAIVSDATVAVDQAAAYVAELKDVPADAKAKIDAALAAAREGLRAGSILLAGASKACESPDVVSAFSAFVESWNALSVLLHQATAGKAGTVALVPLPFTDPLVVRMAASRAAK
jgi:hypothetical protein